MAICCVRACTLQTDYSAQFEQRFKIVPAPEDVTRTVKTARNLAGLFLGNSNFRVSVAPKPNNAYTMKASTNTVNGNARPTLMRDK